MEILFSLPIDLNISTTQTFSVPQVAPGLGNFVFLGFVARNPNAVTTYDSAVYPSPGLNVTAYNAGATVAAQIGSTIYALAPISGSNEGMLVSIDNQGPGYGLVLTAPDSIGVATNYIPVAGHSFGVIWIDILGYRL